MQKQTLGSNSLFLVFLMQFTEAAFSPVSPVLVTRSKTWKQLISHHPEAFITPSLWSTRTKKNSVRRQRQYLTAECSTASWMKAIRKGIPLWESLQTVCSLYKEVVSQLVFSKWETTTLLKLLAQGHAQFTLMPRSELGFSNAQTLPTMKYYIYHLLIYQTRYNFFFLILHR